jgi:hypothetical protein
MKQSLPVKNNGHLLLTLRGSAEIVIIALSTETLCSSTLSTVYLYLTYTLSRSHSSSRASFQFLSSDSSDARYRRGGEENHPV